MKKKLKKCIQNMSLGILSCSLSVTSFAYRCKDIIQQPKCRFLSQRLTFFIPDPYTLSTPFGDVILELKRGKNGQTEILANASRSLSYKTICNYIEKVVKHDSLQTLAVEINNYLRKKYNSNCKEKDFRGILKIIKKCTKQSGFFNQTKYFKPGITKNQIEQAKKATATLCATLFICEQSKNRLPDGGKLSRASLRPIMNGTMTFSDVYGRETKNFYPPANKGGAGISRRYSEGSSSESEIEQFNPIRHETSEISRISANEKTTICEKENKEISIINSQDNIFELKNQINQWLSQATFEQCKILYDFIFHNSYNVLNSEN